MRQFLSIMPNSRAIEECKMESRWPVVQLKELVVSDAGIIQGPGNRQLYQEYYCDNGLPLLQADFVSSLRFSAPGYQYILDDARDVFPQYIVLGADILMSQDGENAGASAIVPIFHEHGILDERCIRIRINSDICETFYLLNILHYYYHIGILDNLLKMDSRGITVCSLSELTIPLPPMDEQKCITDSLLGLSGAIVAQETYREALLELKNMIHEQE